MTRMDLKASICVFQSLASGCLQSLINMEMVRRYMHNTMYYYISRTLHFVQASAVSMVMDTTPFIWTTSDWFM
jgi:hypothetical protein